LAANSSSPVTTASANPAQVHFSRSPATRVKARLRACRPRSRRSTTKIVPNTIATAMMWAALISGSPWDELRTQVPIGLFSMATKMS